ncbi:hypothetical protein PM082_008868 [Marasmius tenuissimus]|nr:hypothetical protein PM082_008868 [Marasmius tenuissimus]
MHHPLSYLTLLVGLAFVAVSTPLQHANASISSRADPSKVGYFFVHFYDRQPAIFAHLSNGNDPLSYRALNGDNAILVPTGGTRAARDPYLVSAPDDSRHWIIATDLDIDAINGDWGRAVTHGSRSLHIWESTDLVNWEDYRLVEVIGPTAGMVWAPEAIWDSSRGAYLVHWASRLFDESDTEHTGTATNDQIMYAHTNDFRTFTAAETYIAEDFPVIDLTILPLGGNSYARFTKDENVLRIYQEMSTDGLFGSWSRVGEFITNTVTEGPLVFEDNQEPGLVHLFMDAYTTAGGYIPYQTTDINSGSWTAGSVSSLPALLKHGVVKPVNQEQYDAIQAKWP